MPPYYDACIISIHNVFSSVCVVCVRVSVLCACCARAMCVLHSCYVHVMYVLFASHVQAICVLCVCYGRDVCVVCASQVLVMCVLFMCVHARGSLG